MSDLASQKGIKDFLHEWGVRPKKGLSQNFLIDQNIVQKILCEAAVAREDHVLEIGPGPGVLTEALVDIGAKVHAVELDRIFAKALKRLPVTVSQGDILHFSLDTLEKKGKVVANLPYHITAPILTHLVTRRDLFSNITVMIQEEVARRITATPGSKIYGSLTVFLNFYSTPRYGFKVSRTCFYPAPRVDSAVITLTPKAPPKGIDPVSFFKLVRTAFGQRRKMLKNTLASLYEVEDLVEVFEKEGISLKARPEELSLSQFLALYSGL